MASQCSVGTDREIVTEPVFSDLTGAAELAQLRSWVLEVTRRVNTQQRSIVCLNGEITRLEALVVSTAAGLASGTATNTADIATNTAAIAAQIGVFDAHDHEVLIGTAAGGDAVEFSGGVDGTLDAPTGAGGNARTEVYVAP